MFFKPKSISPESNFESLIQKCIEGNSTAQRELIKQYLGYAKTVCSRYANSTEELEEMVNDSFLKVFNNLSKYDTLKPFKAWFRTILVNASIDYYHKYEKFTNQTDIEEYDFVDVEYDVVSKMSVDEIMEIIQELTPAYRMVFTLYVMEGYNHREIAEMLNIKEGTSKSNLQDARHKLQSMIQLKYPHLSKIYALKITRSHEK
jgi:RNA polymerase sigma-70 factor, ECF subfamily